MDSFFFEHPFKLNWINNIFDILCSSTSVNPNDAIRRKEISLLYNCRLIEVTVDSFSNRLAERLHIQMDQTLFGPALFGYVLMFLSKNNSKRQVQSL